MLFGLVGIDVYSGEPRFTFGLLGLAEGIHFIVVAMGLFAFAEIVQNLEVEEQRSSAKVRGLMPTWAELNRARRHPARTGVGGFFGLLPGAGPTISAFGA